MIEEQAEESAAEKTATVRPIVVGIDGSTVSEKALLWAANQAQLCNAQLRVVLVRPHPIPITAMAPQPIWPWPVIHQRDEEEVAVTIKMLSRIVFSTIPEEPDVDVVIEVIDGPTGSSLIDVATDVDAQLLVVGRRGIGGFKRLLLGSVSEEVSTYAPCPVVVAAQRDTDHAAPVIVVGVDGSEQGDRALRWASDQARATGHRLHVVYSWERPYIAADSLAGAMPSLGPDLQALEVLEQEVLANILVRCAADFEGIEVSSQLREGHPAEQLTLAAHEENSELLVVGSRGLGGFSAMLLGSVAQQCLRHANCAVAVIRPRQDPQAD